jgi:hypothetical protein
MGVTLNVSGSVVPDVAPEQPARAAACRENRALPGLFTSSLFQTTLLTQRAAREKM